MPNHENEIIELQALLKREEEAGYGAMKTRCCTLEICQRLYKVVDHYGFDREVVAVALNYCDRYFKQSRGGLTNRKVSLILIASTFIAIKMKVSMDDTQANRLVRGLCTLAQGGPVDATAVLDTEKELFATLDWRLNVPTMQQFALTYCDLHPLERRRDDNDDMDYLYNISHFKSSRLLSTRN